MRERGRGREKSQKALKMKQNSRKTQLETLHSAVGAPFDRHFCKNVNLLIIYELFWWVFDSFILFICRDIEMSLCRCVCVCVVNESNVLFHVFNHHFTNTRARAHSRCANPKTCFYSIEKSKFQLRNWKKLFDFATQLFYAKIAGRRQQRWRRRHRRKRKKKERQKRVIYRDRVFTSEKKNGHHHDVYK